MVFIADDEHFDKTYIGVIILILNLADSRDLAKATLPLINEGSVLV